MTIAHNYMTTLRSMPANRQSESLWEQPGFEATVSYTPAPHRDRILTFADGSVYSYEQGWAFSREEWTALDKSVDEFWGADQKIKVC